MALWAAKDMGILFGGVTDEDTDEETMTSVFWSDLYGFNLAGKGRWVSLNLKKPKKKGSGPGNKHPAQSTSPRPEYEFGQDELVAGDGSLHKSEPRTAIDPEDPALTIPSPRYNAMLAVLRNTLYIYGGIFEKGSREYTLDDFYSLQLDKLDRYVCLKKSEIIIPEGDVSSSEDEGDDVDDDDDDDDANDDDNDDEDDSSAYVGETREDDRLEAKVEGENEDVQGGFEKVSRKGARQSEITVTQVPSAIDTALENPTVDCRSHVDATDPASKDGPTSPEDAISTPLPGETLAMFYGRSREHWAQKAVERSDNRGKMLRRDGFALAEERYHAYKPTQEQLEKILTEAGLDEDEMRLGATAGGAARGAEPGQSRNRR